MDYNEKRTRQTGDARGKYDRAAGEDAYVRRHTAPVYENQASNAYRPGGQRADGERRRSISYDEYMAEQRDTESGYRADQAQRDYDYDYEPGERSSRTAHGRNAAGDYRARLSRSETRGSYDDDYEFDRSYRTRSGSTRRPSTNPRSRRSNSHSGRNAVLALLAMALLVMIPLSIKGLLDNSQPGAFMNGLMSSVPTAETPFDDVFASPTPEPQTTLAAVLPTTEPTAAPTPAPTEVPGRVLDPNKKAIALTFDDGPSKYTREILATLAEVDGRATFFVVGKRLDDYSETLQMTYDSGSQIGMHTYNHANLTKISKSEIRDEIDDTNDLIEHYLGERSKLVRPPYGSVNSKVKETVEQPLINWSLDTRDWESRDADSVEKEIMENVQDGDIILMHDLYSSTAEAVKRVVSQLVEQGYQLCTVEELFELKGIELHSGTVFRSAKKSSDD